MRFYTFKHARVQDAAHESLLTAGSNGPWPTAASRSRVRAAITVGPRARSRSASPRQRTPNLTSTPGSARVPPRSRTQEMPAEITRAAPSDVAMLTGAARRLWALS